jgi:hypothetical protein
MQTPAPGSPEAYFVRVCQDAGFKSTKKIDNNPPTYSMTVTDDKNNESVIFISLFGEKDSKGEEIISILMITRVLEIPQNAQIPPQFLRKAVEFNARTHGKIALVNNKIYYANTFWLMGLTPGTLHYEVVDAHFTRVELNKALAPFLYEQ